MAIYQLLDDPEKTLALKRHLTPGKKAPYFPGRKNAVIDDVLLEVKNTKSRLKDLSDNKVWLVPIRISATPLLQIILCWYNARKIVSL